MMKKYLTLLLSFVMIADTNAQPKKKIVINNVTAFDNYLQKAMQVWQIPGMAVALVKDNKIIFTKGYGVRETGTNKLVNTKTLFACASTTKAMTAVCMGILADKGKVHWTDAVIKYLPSFKLYDPYVTRELTIQDLFTHNSGVGNTDFLWAENNISSDEILERIQLVKPSYSLLSSFIYQNIFYLVAGKIIEKITGKSWQVFIKEQIFNPLGMMNTYATLKEIKDENIAKPHYLMEDKVTMIQKDTADAIGPAGSVVSCADDIALWMKAMIDSSKYNGGRLVSPATWEYLLQPKIIVTESEFYPTQQLTKPNFTTYAMGWFQQDYKGYKLNYHTGSLAGEIAIHAQIPNKKFGVYVFGNLDHAELRHALVFKAIDLFESGGNTDWSNEFKTLYDSLKAADKKADSANMPIQTLNSNLSLPLQSYAGTYADELYGTIKITVDNNHATVLLNNVLSGKLTHFHFNTFKVAYKKIYYQPDYYTFQLDNGGKIAGVAVGGNFFKKQ